MGKTDPQRESKHAIILNSIERLGDVRRDLQHLYDEIVGAEADPKEPTVGVPSRAPVTLLYVMDNAASLIREESDRISGLTNEIRSQIF